MRLIFILDEAREAAQKASLAKYEELKARGPKYEVVNADIFGKQVGPAVGTMLDVCGFATCYVPVRQMSRRNAEVKALLAEKHLHYSDYNKACYIYTGGQRQEMSVNVAGAEAARDVFQKHGYTEAYVTSRID